MRDDLEQLTEGLKEAGARFVYLVGSRARGTARPDSDIDLAAYFGRTDVAPWTITGIDFERVDLVVLDTAPLELTGRAALDGQLLFERDPSERVRWEATTRKIYLDELPRMRRATADFVAGAKRRAAGTSNDGRS
jgi:predicted nucleotidyltransferase